MAGTTPVAIDSVDEPAKVYEYWGDICITPCVVNLAPGVHDLHFRPVNSFSERTGSPSITVGTHALVVRYAMGRVERNQGLLVGGVVSLSLGLTVGMTAVPFAADSSTRDVGEYVGIGAAVAIVAGIIMMIEGRDAYQDGAGVQWDPPDGQIVAP